MKRVIACFVSIILLFSLCACSGANQQLKAADVNAELLLDTWRMNFYIGTDAEAETYFLKFELDVTFSELTKDMYSMAFKTVSASYADGTTDNMIIHALPDEYVDSGEGAVPDITGGAMGLVSDGTLTFQIPGFEGAMMHMDFVRVDGAVYGVALEKDVNSGNYFSLEMYKDK